MRNTLSVLYIVRKNRKDKNGLCRISVRITIQGKAVECNTPMKIPPELWSTSAGYAVGRTKLATETNITIRLISCRISEIYNRQFIEDGYTTAALVRNEFLGIKLISKTVLGLMDKKIENKKKQVGISIKPESVTKYEVTRKKLADFLYSQKKMKDLPITRVDYDFINEFNVFLRSKYRCGQNTTVRHLRHLKQIICEAIAKGYLNKNPFHGILLPIKKSDRAYLIKSEIEKVINVKLKQRTLIDIRNIFIFCCYTGLSYIDVMNLRKNDIIRNESGEQYILKRRIKSGIQYYIPLFNTPIKIMESYEEYTFPDKKIFPYYACQNE